MMRTRHTCARPAFLTGTSSEYLGARPLPRVLRSRPHVVLLGPPGVGKTRVARHLAGPGHKYMDRQATQAALVAHVRHRAWASDLLTAKALVLDGPVWLHHRPAAIAAFRALLDARSDHDLRTFVCQDPHGGSVYPLVDGRPPGSTVLVGLRFPEGRRGRRRFALRACSDLGLPETAAQGLDKLEPWNYARLLDLFAAMPTVVP